MQRVKLLATGLRTRNKPKPLDGESPDGFSLVSMGAPTVHAPGDIVDMDDASAELYIRLGAVEPARTTTEPLNGGSQSKEVA